MRLRATLAVFDRTLGRPVQSLKHEGGIRAEVAIEMENAKERLLAKLEDRARRRETTDF